MLKKVVITNCFGECMEYAIDGVQAENPSGLIITSIDGLGPVKADINMMDLATTDGQLYNSARLSGRNIVIKALFTHASSIEEARLLSYKYFPIKKKLKFHIETDNRIGEVEGYVESNEPDIFSDQSGCQISILCENAYFDGGEVKYVFGEIIPQFKFAFGNASLDDKLIKMSEYATEKNTRTLIYNGDADTGMEIEVGAPTDDILDTFSVTGIEVTCNDKKIGIDTSKFVKYVPNTAPDNYSSSECSFIYGDNDRYRFLTKMPFGLSSHNTAVNYNGKVYYFPLQNGKYYVVDGNEFVKAGDDPINKAIGIFNPKQVVVYRGEIHVLGDFNGYDQSHYKLNVEQAKWTKVDSHFNFQCSHGCCVVYDDAIHVIGGSASGTQNTKHLKWSEGDTQWTVVGDAPIIYGGTAVTYHGAIHLMGGVSPNNAVSIAHRAFDGTTWTQVDYLPSNIVDGRAVVYRDTIHLLGGSDSDDVNMHYRWIENAPSNKWTTDPVANIPYAFDGGSAVATESVIYLLGGSNSVGETYTEEPNNDHLIENDRLVINTNKGKKSVYLYRNGNKYNVINTLDKGSSWPQLHRGANHVTYNTETGFDDVQLTITTNKWYEGV